MQRAHRPRRFLLVMRSFFLGLLLLAGCGTGVDMNRSDGDREADRAIKTAVQTATLTGLYEGGFEPQRSQLCILDRGTGDARFGLVVRGNGEASCSGAGAAVREGATLRLTMEGDEACTIQGQMNGGEVSFAAAVGPGCAYYCGGGASLAGARFVKVGGTAEEAARARDLVGDPLCG